MSSASPYEPGRVRRAIFALADKMFGKAGSQQTKAQNNNAIAQAVDKIARMGMTRRQQELNWLWSWYRMANYSSRMVGWDGKAVYDPVEHEQIASESTIPNGFVDYGLDYPLKFRKPTAPYGLVRVIVDRFTGMLFSEQSHPKLTMDGDPDTEDMVDAIIEATRFWSLCALAREYGGAMGTTCAGFQFVDGKPIIEIHDPRWMRPVFLDRMTHKLKSIEKRYMYPEEERDPETGLYVPVWYWYRRIIDDESDTLFEPAKIVDAEEPDWQIQKQTNHGLGVCPVVWVQNLPVQDDIDGDPDCHGIYDGVQSYDELMSQAEKAVKANCDPTLLIVTEDDLSEVRKGSDNAIKLSKGDAKYLEISGAGIDRSLTLAGERRKTALEVAQCVLEHPDQNAKTATEIERVYSSMISKADRLREQYGQNLVIALFEMVVAAARKLGAGKVDADGNIVRQVLVLPDKATKNPDGTITRTPRKLGPPGGKLSCVWPGYFDATVDDASKAVTTAVAAKTGGVVDSKQATKFVSKYFDITDVDSTLEHIKSEAKENEAHVMSNLVPQMDGKP